MNGITLEIFLLIVAASAIAVLQYFRGRRYNLALLRYSMDVLEKILRPRDKIFHVVGLYVGYKGVLWLDYKALSRSEVTVLLMPRYSAFYYPLSKLITRFDKVYLTYWFNRDIGGEAHVIKEGAYRRSPKSVVKNVDKMQFSETFIKGNKYYLVYDDGAIVRKLVRFIETLSNPDHVNHVAIVPENKSIYIFAKLDITTFEDIVEKSYRFAKTFA